MTTYADTVNETVATTSPITNQILFSNSISELSSILLTGGTSNQEVVSESLSSITSNFENISFHLSTTELLSILFNGGTSSNIIVSEVVEAIESIIDRLVFSSSLSNTLTINSVVTVGYFNAILESLIVNTTITNKKYVLANLLENIINVSNLSSSSTFRNTLSETISAIDVLEIAILETVTEAIVIDDTLTYLHDLRHILSDLLTITSIDSNNFVYLYTISESLSSTDTYSTKLTLRQLLDESIVISIGASPNDTYLAYLLSPETNSISNYDNYNFTLSTKFNNKYLFANSNGLYEFGGTTDDGSTIRSELETVAFNFNSSNLKQVPYLYLGVDSNSSFILKVRVDGKGEFHYKLNKYTNNLMTQKVDIGKGLIGRYFQFEIITDASEFSMESIEFIPLEIRRKL